MNRGLLLATAALVASATPVLSQSRGGLAVSARVVALPLSTSEATIAKWMTDWHEGGTAPPPGGPRPDRGCTHRDAVVARGAVVVTLWAGETAQGRCGCVVTRSVLGN